MCFGNKSRVSELSRCQDKDAALANAIRFKKENSKGLQKVLCKLLLLLIFVLALLALASFAASLIVWYGSLVVLLIGLSLLCFLPIRSCIAFGTSCPYNAALVQEDPMYRDAALLRECWQRASARWQKEDVFDQVVEGFCAFASINCVLSAIFERAYFLQFPRKAGPMTMQQMAEVLTLKLVEDDTVKSEFGDVEIEDIGVVLMEPDKVSLSDFERMIEEMSGGEHEVCCCCLVLSDCCSVFVICD